MTQISERTILFADLRGSTGLFETLGNAEATAVVTQCVAALGPPVAQRGGHVVKTLGDGLMAVFDTPAQAAKAALQMHEALTAVTARGLSQGGGWAALHALTLQIAVARGEVVDMNGDCFGDAVNVAARLLDHAGDSETLVTGAVLEGLPAAQRRQFRSLDQIVLRGRVEPVPVFVLGGRRTDSAATQFGDVAPPVEPDTIRLSWLDHGVSFASRQMPVVLGRSPQAHYRVDDSRVSRSHARLDWHGGGFQLSDLSYNGTYVRFADGEIVSLRRGSCTLHGRGSIGLGGSPADPTSACVRFEVLRFGDADPLP
ncbi:MAG: FHA domain-containing protein [Burkholderiales bacterium]|nr:FHA domain-containing protein [Burkholderiales bacterium]